MEVIVSVDGYETLTDREAVRKAERLNLKKGVVMTYDQAVRKLFLNYIQKREAGQGITFAS